MYFGSLRISEIAAIGIPQLATGPQKCVLKGEHLYLHHENIITVVIPLYHQNSPHKIITSFLAFKDFHEAIHFDCEFLFPQRKNYVNHVKLQFTQST